MKFLVMFVFIYSAIPLFAQSSADSAAVRRAALDYIESQHTPNPQQMARAIHPLLEKRTFWLSKKANREFIEKNTSEGMILTAEVYNKNGDKFPAKPRKEVVILDLMDKTAAVKLYADTWIDHLHLVKINGEWKIINVLWQYYDAKLHQ